MADEEGQEQQPALPGVGLGGPYLTGAVICEKVLREADGVLSAIRMIDRIIVSITQGQAPAEMPLLPINLTAHNGRRVVRYEGQKGGLQFFLGARSCGVFIDPKLDEIR